MDENNLSTEKDIEQTVSPTGTTAVDEEPVKEETESEKVQTSEFETAYETNGELIAMQNHYEYVESKLDDITIIGVVIIIALGLVFGGIACKAFFDFMR